MNCVETGYAKRDPSFLKLLHLLIYDSSVDLGGGVGVAWQRVCFSYPARPDVRVLCDVSLRAAPGSTLALCGGSGSGKSTLLHLLQNFYLPDAGAVLLTGPSLGGERSVSSLPHRDLHRLVALVGTSLWRVSELTALFTTNAFDP